MTGIEMTKEIVAELKSIPTNKLKNLLDYIRFLKIMDSIDPTQLYFWTKRWQKMEREIEKDKKAKRTIGDGTTKGLLKNLKTK